MKYHQAMNIATNGDYVARKDWEEKTFVIVFRGMPGFYKVSLLNGTVIKEYNPTDEDFESEWSVLDYCPDQRFFRRNSTKQP